MKLVIVTQSETIHKQRKHIQKTFTKHTKLENRQKLTKTMETKTRKQNQSPRLCCLGFYYLCCFLLCWLAFKCFLMLRVCVCVFRDDVYHFVKFVARGGHLHFCAWLHSDGQVLCFMTADRLRVILLALFVNLVALGRTSSVLRLFWLVSLFILYVLIVLSLWLLLLWWLHCHHHAQPPLTAAIKATTPTKTVDSTTWTTTNRLAACTQTPWWLCHVFDPQVPGASH